MPSRQFPSVKDAYLLELATLLRAAGLSNVTYVQSRFVRTADRAARSGKLSAAATRHAYLTKACRAAACLGPLVTALKSEE